MELHSLMESSTFDFVSIVMIYSDWGKYPVVVCCESSSGLFGSIKDEEFPQQLSR
jgi:hypothetical protein